MALSAAPSTWGFGIDPTVVGASGTSAGSSTWLSPFSVADLRFRQDFLQKVGDIYNGQEEALLTDILMMLGATKETVTSDTQSWFEKGRILPVVVAGKNDFTSVVKTNTTTITAVGARLPFVTGDTLQVVGTVATGNTGAETTEYLRVTSLSASGLVATVAKTDASTVVFAGNDVRITIAGNTQLKGSDRPSGNVLVQAKQRSNNTKISTRPYDVNYSDFSSLAWAEIDGQFYWTNADMENAFKQFKMYKEFDALIGDSFDTGSAAYAAGHKGMQGLLPALRERGNNWDGYPSTISDFEDFIKRLDEVGAGTNYMLLLSRAADLSLDQSIAQYNNVAIAYDSATPGTLKSSNYGEFMNGDGKFMDLGFKGFKWNSYNFYKQAWSPLVVPTSPLHYSNLASGDIINGLALPYGMTSVSIDGSARNIPYLSMLHKVGNGENRELKTALTGWNTNASDKTEVTWLSEFMLRTACANQMFLFEGTGA